MEEFEVMLGALKVNAFEWAKQIVLAIVIFWIGMRVVKIMMRAVSKALALRDVDASLTTFLQSFLKRFFGAFLIYLINLPIRSKAIFILSGSPSSSGSFPVPMSEMKKK